MVNCERKEHVAGREEIVDALGAGKDIFVVFGGTRTFGPDTVVMGLCKGKDWVVRPGTREFRVRWNGYINSKVGCGLCGRGRKGGLDEWEAHISWALFGQGGDAVVRFCLDSVFGVSETSNGA